MRFWGRKGQAESSTWPISQCQVYDFWNICFGFSFFSI